MRWETGEAAEHSEPFEAVKAGLVHRLWNGLLTFPLWHRVHGFCASLGLDFVVGSRFLICAAHGS